MPTHHTRYCDATLLPAVAYRMTNALRACSLHHDSTRAMEAACTHRGTVADLAEISPALRDQLGLALRIAQRAVAEDIEANADRVDIDGATWWDIAPMTSPHEHSAEVLDMAHEAIEFALLAGLITCHSTRANLVALRNPAG